jgi:hypothetical protein
VRFIFAIICFVLAALSMGLGIAERTFLAGPDQVTASTTSTTGAPVVVIDGAALDAYPRIDSVQLTGSSTQFAAYGRTSDVLAWVGDTNYTHVTFNAKTNKLVSRLHSGSATTVPNPAGSDLWLGEYQGSQSRNFHPKIPSSDSIIAVSNGTDPAPSKVSLTWPLDNQVAWSGPIIGIGAILLVIGLLLLLWAFTHLRRMRGPRRTQQRMPKLPRQPRYKPSRKAVTATKGRRAINRFVAVVPAVAITGLLLSGCTATPTPTVPTPSQTPTAATLTRAVEPVVSSVQLQLIMQHVSSTVAAADDTSNATTLGTRMEGPALAERTAAYTIAAKDKKAVPPTPIPATTVGNYTLPEASDKWPRTVLTVVQSKADAKSAPIAVMLEQDDPRSNYKVEYAIALQPNIALPDVAPAKIGAVGMDPNGKLLSVQPSVIALDYGDILLHDTSSASYPLFQAEGDTFRTQVGMQAKIKQQKSLPSTAKLTFANAQGSGRTIALATLNAGAIVAVDLNEIETVRPVKAGASVSAPGGIRALSGKATSSKGLVATYDDQLLFFVPGAGKSGKIVLLGFSQGLIAAQEFKK